MENISYTEKHSISILFVRTQPSKVNHKTHLWQARYIYNKV